MYMSWRFPPSLQYLQTSDRIGSRSLADLEVEDMTKGRVPLGLGLWWRVQAGQRGLDRYTHLNAFSAAS
jgi:hypothetical protein